MGWGQLSENRELFSKTKEVFRKAWFMLPTNKPCSYYTKRVLSLALAETKVVISDKAKAASVMVQVLDFAHWAEPKYNPKPDFTLSELTAYSKLPKDELDKVKEEESDNDLDVDPISGEKKVSVEDFKDASMAENVKKMAEPFVKVKPEAIVRREKELEEKGIINEDMKKRVEKIVAQIDPKTLKVVKMWDVKDAEKAFNTHNILRAVERGGIAKGYHWCKAADVDAFKPYNGEKKKKAGAVNAKKRKTAVKPKNDVYENTRNDNDISHFTDAEIITEIRRRGWQGRISITLNIDL